MVRLAVSSITFSDVEGIAGRPARTYTIEDIFRITREMGVHGVEVTSSLITSRMQEVGQMARKYQVNVLGLNDGIPEYGGSQDLDSFRAALTKVKELGGTYVTSMVTDALSLGEAIAHIIAEKAAAQHAGLTYFLETHRHSITESAEDTRVIAEAVPDLRFNVDLSHWIVLRYAPAEIAWIFPRAGHMQVRVACEDNVQVEVGDGKTRQVETYLEQVVAPVLERGSVGVLVAEVIPQLMSTQKYYPVEDTFNLLRELRSRFSHYIEE